MNLKTTVNNLFGKLVVWSTLLKFPSKRLGGTRRTNLYNAALKSYLSKDKSVFNAVKALKEFPVTIEEFLTSKEYLGAAMDYYPGTIQKLKDTLPDVWGGESLRDKGVMITFAGSREGKTTLLTATLLYIYYIHTCFNKYDTVKPFSLLIGSSTIRGSEVLLNTVRGMMYKVPHFEKVSTQQDITKAKNVEILTVGLRRECVLGTGPAAYFLENVGAGSLSSAFVLDSFVEEVSINFICRGLTTPPEILFPFTQGIYAAID